MKVNFTMKGMVVLLMLMCSSSVMGAPPSGGGTLSFGRFGTVHLYGNRTNPEHVILFVSGDGGWNRGAEAMSQTIATEDTLIIGVDIVHYLHTYAPQLPKKTAKPLKPVDPAKQPCFYPAGDFEALSQYIQIKLGLSAYHHPVLVGYSSGATLVYAVLVEAPKTFPGAISVGFCPDLILPRPVCKGDGLAYTVGPKDKGFLFQPASDLDVPWIVLLGEKDEICDPPATRAFVNEVTGGSIRMLPEVGHEFEVNERWLPQYREAFGTIIEHEKALERAAKPAGAASAPSASVDDLPLVELPVASSTGSTVAVIVSGDGGWAGIDSDMGAVLQKKGIPVVGLDSLKYFWGKKTPDVAAEDMARILRHYGEVWNKPNFLLIGYSRGADVLPFMVNRLPEDLKNRVLLLALLGLSETVAFEFHLSDWLGGASDGPELPIRPEVEKLKGMNILCFCGQAEEDSLCRKLDGSLVETITLKGGHHFDGDYEGIVDRLLTRLESHK